MSYCSSKYPDDINKYQDDISKYPSGIQFIVGIVLDLVKTDNTDNRGG